MIPTATVAAFFASAYVFGLELGMLYGFLRPLRPRHTLLSDGLFLLGLYQRTAVLMFRVCGGELRPACLVALFLGIWTFDRTVGRLLRPLFGRFWKFLSRPGASGVAAEKIFEIRKKYVCIWGKMGYNRTEVYPPCQIHSRRCFQ